MAVPALEERFLEPPGWRWHHLTRNGRKLRFGTAAPKNSIPHAVVVCLPGLSEFGEKYFEVARDCLNMNLSFWVIDWMGQGKSDRYLKNPHARHSRGFYHDVEDLHDFILGYIKHSAVHPDVGRIPMVMLAHSMGANIGLHYLAQNPGSFECAAFSAPMIGVKALEVFSRFAVVAAEATALFAGPTSYVIGAGDWRESLRPSPGADLFSSDPVRGAVHNAWCLADPALQVGGVTYGWVVEAARSAAALQDPNLLRSIQTHCLVAMAGHEQFVSNKAIKKAVSALPHAKLIEFPESRHEILMERDEIRKAFLNAFYEMIQDRIIKRPETLKPF